MSSTPKFPTATEAAPATRSSPFQNMWRTMRMMPEFTPNDIAAHSCTDDVAVTPGDARTYCQALARGGYLRIVRKAAPGRREAVYRLIRNSGPQPPVPRRVSALHDPNTGETTQIAGVRK